MRLALALAALLVPGAGLAQCRDDVVDLRGAFGQLRFHVELADDPGERAQGLMYRESLPRFSGMLFVYDRPERASFWMKNTRIPLDMLFIDETGTVAHVHHRAVPGDLTPIGAPGPTLAVLEINGGLSEALGIGPGTQVRHPAFVQAAWPCD